MSNTQTIMKLESLPNETLIQCFEYFNAHDIFHSFDQLNDRFNHLIRHIPLCINLEEDVNKSIFDKFCIKILLNPQIKDQVYLLNLPSPTQNDPASLRTKTFLSFFSLDDFWNLQKFKTGIYQVLISMGTKLSQLNSKYTLELSIASFPKLRALSICSLDERTYSLENTNLSITNLTLGGCYLDTLYYLSKHAPMLKYLHVGAVFSSKNSFNNSTQEYCLHLKQLIIDSCWYSSFDNFEKFVKLTPNLKSLTICNGNDGMIDAARWEQLITSSLPYLDTIQFKFSYWYSKAKHDIIINKFKEFQTDFWQKQHNWFIEYAVRDFVAVIYTIPYALNSYELKPHYKRYRNDLKSNVNTFVNVTNLTLHYEILTKKCEDYFSNVTSLKLYRSPRSSTIQQIECLGEIVNPFHLKHLDIFWIDDMISSLLLLKLFEQMPQLSVLSIRWNQLTQFFNNAELCKYLNKMIKRLHINESNDHLGDDLFKRKEFYEVFSNIEHLQFAYGRGDELLFSLNRLPKLSTLKGKWKTEGYPKRYLSKVKNQIEKLNVIYNIDVNEVYDMVYNSSRDDYQLELDDNRYEIEVWMWFGNNMS